MFWIGISGPIASGKSTLAKALYKKFHSSKLEVAIIPLARAVRDVAALEPWDEPQRIFRLFTLFTSWGYSSATARTASEAANQAFKTFPSTAGQKNRRLLQTLGIEVGRDILGEDVWIKRVFEAGKNCHIVISDDLRFDNEADKVDLHIGIDITADTIFYSESLARLSVDNKQYGFTDHVSERSLTRRPDIIVPVGFSDAHVAAIALHVNVSEIIDSRAQPHNAA